MVMRSPSATIASRVGMVASRLAARAEGAGTEVLPGSSTAGLTHVGTDR